MHWIVHPELHPSGAAVESEIFILLLLGGKKRKKSHVERCDSFFGRKPAAEAERRSDAKAGYPDDGPRW